MSGVSHSLLLSVLSVLCCNTDGMFVSLCKENLLAAALRKQNLLLSWRMCAYSPVKLTY